MADRKTKPARKHKLTDVAALAGVSTSTASRVITKPYMVSEELRAKVQRAIDELGYRPPATSKPASGSRKGTIGVIVPTLDIATFATGVSALQARLSDAGFMLQLAISNFSPSHEMECVRELLGSGVDGLMLVGTRHEPAVYEMLDRAQIPYVNTWDFIDSDVRPCIGFDNREAARHISNYVLDAGHRRIAIIAGGGPQRSDRSTARLEGCLAALQERGITLSSDQVIELPYLMQAGSAAIRKLLELATPPTAVICTNDILAIGAMLESQRQGIRIPDELSFTGFDDLAMSSLVLPGLTTIHIPAHEMGILAAEYLTEQVNGRNPLRRVKLDYSLIVRGSVARWPNPSP